MSTTSCIASRHCHPFPMDSELYVPAALLVASASATHLWFKNFEPRAYAPVLIAVFLVPAPLCFSLMRNSYSIFSAILLGYSSFYVSLCTSIVAYRLSPLHPLAKYPGPFLARTTKIWTVWKAFDGKLPQYYERLHAQYGSIVRTGPNEISVIEKDMIPHILGSQGMPKGPLWEGRRITPSKDKGNYSLIGQRDSNRHAQLRKAWNRAFSAEALLDYQDILVKRARELASRLEATYREGQKQVDIAKWISYFSFDFMGELAFGGGFDLLQNGDKNGYQAGMEKALMYVFRDFSEGRVKKCQSLPSLTQQIPWLAHAIRLLPVGGSATSAFGAFAVKQAKIRSTQNVTQKDLFYHLVTNTYSDEDESPFPLIVSNAVLAIIAGSDTTASVLSNAVYYLLANPQDLDHVRQEIDQALPRLQDGSTPSDMQVLAGLPWLNAVINETLRLQPPVPTGLQRAPERGSGGKMIGTIFLKEGTAVQVPPYVLHRDPRYFSPDPQKFWPERWIRAGEDPKIVLELGAFVPFSSGPANCAGKRLALLELRVVLALLISRFELSFATGWDVRNWEKNLRD
ncbi:cytochrome p450, partial [Moniliophthora roreri]